MQQVAARGEEMSRKLKWFEKLSDADLLGISCAIQNGLDTGYYEGDLILWAEGMLAKIMNIRLPEAKK
jgi:hypothetical protein